MLFSFAGELLRGQAEQHPRWQVAVDVHPAALRAHAGLLQGVDLDQLTEAYVEIDTLEKARVGAETFARHSDIAAWLLVPGIVLILLELVAHATWWRRAP